MHASCKLVWTLDLLDNKVKIICQMQSESDKIDTREKWNIYYSSFLWLDKKEQASNRV